LLYAVVEPKAIAAYRVFARIEKAMDVGLEELFGVGDAERELAACGAVIAQFRCVFPNPAEGDEFRSGGPNFADVPRNGDEKIILARLESLSEVAVLLDLSD
jgi:hypothetical protein